MAFYSKLFFFSTSQNQKKSFTFHNLETNDVLNNYLTGFKSMINI